MSRGKPALGWRQISLRAAQLLMLLLGAALGLWMRSAHRQRRAINQLAKFDIVVQYSFQRDEIGAILGEG